MGVSAEEGEGSEGLDVEEDILNLVLLVMLVIIEPRELNVRVRRG